MCLYVGIESAATAVADAGATAATAATAAVTVVVDIVAVDHVAAAAATAVAASIVYVCAKGPWDQLASKSQQW